jgi:hypothetical protein
MEMQMIKRAPPVYPPPANLIDEHVPAVPVEPMSLPEAMTGRRTARTTNIRTVVAANTGGHGHRNLIALSENNMIEKLMKDMKEVENESVATVVFRKMSGMKKGVFEVRVTLVSGTSLGCSMYLGMHY